MRVSGRPRWLLLLALLWPSRVARADEDDSGRPRLVVLVVVDQLGEDLLERMAPRLHANDQAQGFRRLAREGAWWTDCRLRLSSTSTAAGHATIASGAYPCVHGIVGNRWWERGPAGQAGHDVYCVADPAAQVFGAAEAATAAQRSGPANLRGESIGDALKASLPLAPRVVSVSLKDRAAILLAGRRADACFWLDTRAGGFVACDRFAAFREGSDEQRAGLRKAVEGRLLEFNRTRLGEFVREWTLEEHAPLGYDEAADDARPEEGEDAAFPHGPLLPDDVAFAEASPAGNDMLVAFLDALVPLGPAEGGKPRDASGERLALGGRAGATDLLCVSFSSPDLVGRRYGPESQEAADDFVRLDRTLERLLALLDRKVGRGRWLLALTSDHGAAPLPEAAARDGLDAGRVTSAQVVAAVERALASAAPAGEDPSARVAGVEDGNVYLSVGKALGDAGRAGVEATVRSALLEVPGVWRAYTRTQLLDGRVPDDAPGRGAVHSFDASRSGDVVFQLRPHWVLAGPSPGTASGQPWAYDSRVPLFLLGPGVRACPHLEPASVVDIAATLAALLHVAPPAGCEGRVLAEGISLDTWRTTVPLR